MNKIMNTYKISWGEGGGGLKSIRLPCEKYAKYIKLIDVKQQLHKKVAMSADIT